MTAARQRGELVSQIAGVLAGMLPGLEEQAALGAAGQAAGTVPGCRVLLEHLRYHPDALSSGSAAAPLSLIRLAHALTRRRTLCPAAAAVRPVRPDPPDRGAGQRRRS